MDEIPENRSLRGVLALEAMTDGVRELAREFKTEDTPEKGTAASNSASSLLRSKINRLYASASVSFCLSVAPLAISDSIGLEAALIKKSEGTAFTFVLSTLSIFYYTYC